MGDASRASHGRDAWGKRENALPGGSNGAMVPATHGNGDDRAGQDKRSATA